MLGTHSVEEHLLRVHQTLSSSLSTMKTKIRCQGLRTVNSDKLPLPLKPPVFYMVFCSYRLQQLKSTLATNIISVIFASVGVILFVWDLNINGYYYQNYWMMVSILPWTVMTALSSMPEYIYRLLSLLRKFSVFLTLFLGMWLLRYKVRKLHFQIDDVRKTNPVAITGAMGRAWQLQNICRVPFPAFYNSA